jgi:disulfide bond formation protein DsbB
MLGIAALKNDRRIIPYALSLSIAGGVIALYHYMEQQIPALQSVLPCRVGVPCHLDYLDWFGWITIPLLALIAFILISVSLFLARETAQEQSLEETE